MARLTQEEARALVDRAGGQLAAAREVGVPPSTFRMWLYPEETRASNREANLRYSRNLTGTQYAKKLLRNRRYAALRRMTTRNQRRESTSG